MNWYEKGAVLGRMALRRPRELLPLLRDRKTARKLRQELPKHGEIQATFSRVSVLAPTRTDLEQFEEIWVGQGYGMHEDFVPRPEWTVVDVGANIGCFTLWAAMHMQRGRIWSFEPILSTFTYLERNIYENQPRFPGVEIHVQSYAVADVDDTLSMLLVAESTGWNRLVAGDELTQETRTVVPVPAKPLDALIPDIPVDLLKVDVEGAELQVFQGAANTLQRTWRVVMEYHHEDLLKNCRLLLEASGFRMVLQTPGPNLGMAYFSR